MSRAQTPSRQKDEFPIPNRSVGRLHLSGEQLDQVFSLIASGKRGQSASLISASLEVNDFMAEWAVRHIEGRLKVESNFRSQALEQFKAWQVDDAQSSRSFLGQVFGIQGHAANGLVAKLKP